MQGEDQLGTLRSHSPDASPPTPERRWPGKPRRETATSDVCFDSGTTQLQPAFVRESQSPESPDGSSGGEVTGATQEVPPSSSAAAPADEIQPAGQRGTSEASQQLQALAHHLMDEVSQVRHGCNGCRSGFHQVAAYERLYANALASIYMLEHRLLVLSSSCSSL